MKNKVMHYDFEFICSGLSDNDWIVFKSDKQKLGKEAGKPHLLDNPYFYRQFQIMQFIGVTDKNNKEIYEDDVVEIDDGEISVKKIYRGKIYFCTDYTLTDNPCFAVWTKSGYKKISPNIEILGNIYENSELLKEVK